VLIACATNKSPKLADVKKQKVPDNLGQWFVNRGLAL